MHGTTSMPAAFSSRLSTITRSSPSRSVMYSVPMSMSRWKLKLSPRLIFTSMPPPPSRPSVPAR